MRRSINIIGNTDWLTVFFYLLLVVFGWVNIFAVNFSDEQGFSFSMSNRYTMQIIWILVSIGLAIFIFLIDSEFYNFIAYPFYGICMLVLLAVLIVGKEVNGAKSWIIIGPLSLQPSEFAKLATILALSKFLSEYNVKFMRAKNIVISILIISFPILFIMLQPDFGSTLVYGILLLMLYREGLPGWVLLLIVLFTGLFIGTIKTSQFFILPIVAGIGILASAIIGKSFKNFYIGALITGLVSGISYLLYRFFSFTENTIVYYLITIGAISAIAIIVAKVKKVKGLFLGLLLMLSLICFF